MPYLQTALLLILPVMVISAALRDLTSYTIPNWISGVLILGFLAAAPALGLSLQAVGLHVGIGLIALVLGMVMFALRWIGGGDAKLFAAAALWLGWPAAIDYLMVICAAGGGLALGLMTLRSAAFRPLALMGPPWFGRLATPGENVPYGVAIAAGALAAFPGSSLMLAFPGFG